MALGSRHRRPAERCPAMLSRVRVVCRAMPDWFDLDALRAMVAGSTIFAALGVVAALVFVRTAARRIVLLLVCGAVAAGSLWYGTMLDDCEARCSCKFIFDKVRIDSCIDSPTGG